MLLHDPIYHTNTASRVMPIALSEVGILVQNTVISHTLATPPSSPAVEILYI